MRIVPLFLLTLGAINWGYAYPLVFLFVALLRQRMLGREIYFNFLYAPGFWLLLSAGMTYAYLIRRLTPLECERLQGFPDGWTDIPDASDSAQYKALGNSVAIPCVEFIMGRIAAALRAV